MRSIYKDKRIPLQFRRLMIFNKICRKAKKHPDEIVHLSPYSKIALSVIYSKKNNQYVAFGSVFKYAHTRAEVIEQGVDKLPHEEYVMCAITVKKQAFTKAVCTPIELLWHWNSYVKNRAYKCIDDSTDSFFPVNDELEIDYPAHEFHERLVASAQLPLWGN